MRCDKANRMYDGRSERQGEMQGERHGTHGIWEFERVVYDIPNLHDIDYQTLIQLQTPLSAKTPR